MDLSDRAADLAGKFSVLGAAFGFVVGLAAACLDLAIQGSGTFKRFMNIWLAGIALGTGGGAALGVGLAVVGAH